MDERKKRLADSLLKAFGGETSEQPSQPLEPPPTNRPLVDQESAVRAQRSMRKAFGGDDDQSVQPQSSPSPDQLNSLSQDLDRILKINQTSPEQQDQQQELLNKLKVDYLRKKSLGQ